MPWFLVQMYNIFGIQSFFFSENSQTLPNIKNEISAYFEWQEIKIKILKFDVYKGVCLKIPQ